MFVDDLFLASRTRVTEFCERLLASKTKITWTCTARVDTVKPQVLDIMRKAGCWEISFGLETGSNELLRKMDKDAKVEESEQAVGWTHAAGIRTRSEERRVGKGSGTQCVAFAIYIYRKVYGFALSIS